MKKFKKVLSLITALCMLATTFVSSSIVSYAEDEVIEEPQYVENEILITVDNDEYDDFEVESEIIGAVEATLSSEVNVDVSVVSNCPINNTSKVYVVDLEDSTDTNTSILDLCSEINENCDNMYAEPNYVFDIEESTLDSGIMLEEFESLVGINGIYSNWHLRDSLATEALGFCEKSGDDVLVAVLDSGCNTNHEHLQDSLMTLTKGPDTYHGFNVTGKDFINDITDRTGHGTAVASLISGMNSTNDTKGIAPDSKILPIKICDLDKPNSYMIIEALRMIRRYNDDWVGDVDGADLEVSVINLSYSFEHYVDYKYDESALKIAIDSMANEYVFVASAGNQSTNTNFVSRYPASYDNVIGVMAYDSTRTMAYYSNYDTRGGLYYNIAAPGSNITVASHSVNNGYVVGSGTSFASPIVAGAVALYISNCPNASIERVKSDLLLSMTDKVQRYAENGAEDGYYKLNVANYLNLGLLNDNSVFSGSCGYDDVTWTYTHSNRSLVITGGDMMDDYTRGGAPWYRFRDLITSCEISDDIVYIGDYAFTDLSVLNNLDLGEGIEYIGNLSFAYCKELGTLVLPDNEFDAAFGSFYACSSLTNIVLPSELYSTSSAYYIFQNCTALTDVTIPNGWTNIPTAMFFGCTGLKNVVLPGTVSIIGAAAFKNCCSLTSINLPEGLLDLSPRAFENCIGLTSVVLPRGLEKIKSKAFSGCTNLETITIYDNLTMMQPGIFNDCPRLSINAYFNSLALNYAQDKSIDYLTIYRLNPLENSSITFDRTNNLISGLSVAVSTDVFEEQYISLDPGYTIGYANNASGLVSAGTIVNVLKSDTIVETYTVV